MPLKIHPSQTDPKMAPTPDMITPVAALRWVNRNHTSPKDASPTAAPDPRATREPLTAVRGWAVRRLGSQHVPLYPIEAKRQAQQG